MLAVNVSSCMDLPSSAHHLGLAHGIHHGLWLSIVFGTPEQHDVRLWPVNGIVFPTTRLLYPKASPLVLRQQPVLWQVLSDFGRQHNMPVFVDIIIVLLRVLNVVVCHVAVVPAAVMLVGGKYRNRPGAPWLSRA
eukprot:GHUV01003334.1.p1 GENE.GHUV01003334.1~~GHUV01003334.1.p1  ORF type:complete len:135 (-),score=16.70 GHUV01003334.1:90-494(-)